MEVIIYFAGVIYFLGIVVMALSGMISGIWDPVLLAPVWPLFWLRFVWRRLRE